MKLEDQICSFELAKSLKELGVKQESHFYWIPVGNGYIADCFMYSEQYEEIDKEISAFTVAELGEILPPFVTTEKYFCKEKPRFNTHEEKTIEQHSFHDDKEADARAKMLIYLIEKGLLKSATKD